MTGNLRGGCDGALLTETSAKDNLVHLLECGFFDAHRQAEKASWEAEPDLAKAKAAVRLVHRVALFDAAGRISGMVSQTDVIRGLATNASSFEDVCFRSLRDLGACRLLPACRLAQKTAGRLPETAHRCWRAARRVERRRSRPDLCVRFRPLLTGRAWGGFRRCAPSVPRLRPSLAAHHPGA